MIETGTIDLKQSVKQRIPFLPHCRKFETGEYIYMLMTHLRGLYLSLVLCHVNNSSWILTNFKRDNEQCIALVCIG